MISPVRARTLLAKAGAPAVDPNFALSRVDGAWIFGDIRPLARYGTPFWMVTDHGNVGLVKRGLSNLEMITLLDGTPTTEESTPLDQ